MLADFSASASARSSAATISPTQARTDHVENVRDQVEKNWNVAPLMAHPELANEVIELRLHSLPDGTVTAVEVMNDRPNESLFRQASQSCVRAVKKSSPLKLPPGKTYETMVLRFKLPDVGS